MIKRSANSFVQIFRSGFEVVKQSCPSFSSCGRSCLDRHKYDRLIACFTFDLISNFKLDGIFYHNKFHFFACYFLLKPFFILECILLVTNLKSLVLNRLRTKIHGMFQIYGLVNQNLWSLQTLMVWRDHKLAVFIFTFKIWSWEEWKRTS